MLTQEEESFINYWSQNRLRKKRWMTQFSIGLPMGVLIVALLFANIISGWHKKAAVAINSNSSVIIVVIIAAVGIVVFMTYFSSKHHWDLNEQRYNELIYKKSNLEKKSS